MNLVLCFSFLVLGMTPSLSAQNFGQVDNGGLTEPIERVIVVNAAGTLFTGSIAGVFRSTDHGVFVLADDGGSWTHLNNGVPDTLVLAITTDENDHVFACTDLGGLFRSTDLGANWTKLTDGLTSDNMTVLMNLGGGVLLAGTDGEGIYRSTNGGDSWVPADSGLTDLTIYVMTKTHFGSIFAGTNTGGAFRSTDNGLSCTGVNNGLINSTAVSLVADPDGRVYAGTAGGGVFLTETSGGVWSELNDGLTNLFVYARAIDSAKYVFAGTVGDGDFRSILPLTAVGAPPPRPVSYSLGQNYPNPFNPGTRLKFAFQRPSVVTLRIFSSLGSVVATLVDGDRRDAGSYELAFDGSGLASGIYFYRLEAAAESGGLLVSVGKMVLLQ